MESFDTNDATRDNVLKISYIEFPAKNLDRIQIFYKKVFGWRFTQYGPDYRSFSDGQVNGGFYRSDLQSRSENGAALVVLYSSNLEATHDHIVDAGGSIVREIFSFPGGKRFHFTDPAGNELAVWSDR